jgi:hypothetical protein
MALLVILVTPALVGPALAEDEKNWAEGYFVPVLINIYPDAGITEQQARESVEEASKILGQANIHLVVRYVETSDVGDDGKDGIFNENERVAIRENGDNEIFKRFKHQGMKVVFAKNVDSARTTTAGWGQHYSRTVMAEYAGKTDETKANETGAVIAHEIGHALTLSGEYVVGTDPATGEEVISDEHGHTSMGREGEMGKKNLMAPESTEGAINLTESQKERIWKDIEGFARCAEQMNKLTPAEKAESQFGHVPDPMGDAVFIGLTVAGETTEPSPTRAPTPDELSTIYDLTQVFLLSVHDSDSIRARIFTGGSMSPAGEIDARYTLGFDSDGNDASGIWYAGKAGVDVVVSISATGNPDAGTLVVSGTVDPLTAAPFPLPTTPEMVVENETTDSFVDEAVSEPATTRIEAVIPKSALGITAIEVPVVATAGDSVMPYDTAFLTFDMERWLKDPTLTTFGTGVPTAGQPYPVAFSGLLPGSPFTLYLDETVMRTGTLDGSGAFSGSFTFPSDLPTDSIHFLTAQDSTGEFAYSITCPGETVPPPPPPETWNMTPVNDTFVDAGFTRYCNQRIPVREATFGSSSALSVVRGRVGGPGDYLYWQGSLLQFDLSKAPASFTKAELVLTMTRSANEPISVHRMLVPWEEAGACFTRPCTICNPWASGWENRKNYAATPTATVHVMGKKGTEIAWDVTADVKAMQAGTPGYGWFLKSAAKPGATDITQVAFCSRETKGCAPVLRFTH